MTFELLDDAGTKPDGAASELTEMLCVSPADIGQVLTSMARSFDAELLAMTESELDSRWYFRWEENASIEWNLYKFSDALEMFKRSCRKWEEHHNGSCCVVERVRDKYLMPKIRAFAVELKTHNAKVTGAEGVRVD